MDRLSDLPNIGKVVEKQLISVGINNKKELMEVGSEVAWLKIREIDSSSCLVKLMALEGAIKGVKIKDINEKDKKRLREFFKSNKL